MSSLDKETSDFIAKNNIFVEVGDPFQDYIESFIPGIQTFGKPNTEATVKKIKGKNSLMYKNQLVYEAKYTFDNIGRRKTPEVKFSKKNKVGIFFGDSMCFGEGLNDNETIPYYFEKSNIDYRSINYGFMGHGPSHMLYTINTPKFKKEFKDKKGKIFYIYRDDAIKICTGKIPWSKGHPKYRLVDDKVVFEGQYGDYTNSEIYLPSNYNENDYKLTTEIFSEAKKTIESISNNLEFEVIILPLSFSNFYIYPKLIDKDIKVINLYHLDLEKLTNIKSRFLDGIHTKYSNQMIVKFLHKKHSKIYLHKDYNNLNELKDRLDLENSLMPTMIDFPYDDAGVIISNMLKHYKGVEKINYKELVNYLENLHKEKIKNISINKVGS